MNDLIIVNNYYPIGYFSATGVDQTAAQGTDQYWASVEKLAPETDWLEFDLGRTRPVNFLDFEISQKPVDLKIEWKDGSDWKEIGISEEFPVTLSINYLVSTDNPWHYFETHFDLVQTRYFRVTFTRRDEAWPFSDSEPFPWSIEVRNLRIMHVIPNTDSFVVDTGEDILGNSYITSLETFEAAKATDGNTTTFWQSQPNPTRNAVECLYFDLRNNSEPVTMEYLNQFQMGALEGRSMADMENYAAGGAVVDEIYLDPVTFGPSMHIYYSNDDYGDWDYKLWIPIPRQYTLKKGYHALPSPTFCKFIKLEFTNLAAAPYNLIEYPTLPQIEYRRFPTWVQNYFTNQYIKQVDNAGIYNPIDRITIDPLELGFRKPEDRFGEGDLSTRQPPDIKSTTEEIKDFIEGLNDTAQSQDREVVEQQINYRPAFMWQDDLILQLDSTHALSRVAKNGDTGWNAELPPTIEPAPALQSIPDLTESEEEKQTPIMWFPRKCRHGYQIVRGDRPSKISYFVAIREVSFHRRNYEAQFDESFYIETLDDTAHIQSNDFVLDDWRYVVEK